MIDAALESVLRRDRFVTGAALVMVTALAWVYVLWLAADMEMGGMDMAGFRMIPAGMGLMMPMSEPWRPIEFAFVFVMWAVMMVGMMTPSVTPMILIYARMGRQATQRGNPLAATGWFVAGYLLVWIVFSLASTVAQWALERLAVLGTRMDSESNLFAAVVLIAAGLYQWSPLKDVCLRQCQAPWQFLQNNGGFRRDAVGSLELGARHGIYCVGCCWFLMALLFVGGVMNVLWVAALAIFVLAEKVIPVGRVVSRIAGVGMMVVGAWWVISSFKNW
jgi:predicted metal-binding membrane protein